MKPYKLFALILLCVNGIAGELSEIHEIQEENSRYEDLLSSRSHDEVESSAHGIIEIGIERTECFGTCPSYTAVIKSDGTFRYTGYNSVKRTGEHTGKVNIWKLRTLLQFIDESEFRSLHGSYSRMVSDNPTVYTMVTTKKGRKIVSNYANSGPTKLWAIEQLIDNLLLEADWDEKSDNESG